MCNVLIDFEIDDIRLDSDTPGTRGHSTTPAEPPRREWVWTRMSNHIDCVDDLPNVDKCYEFETYVIGPDDLAQAAQCSVYVQAIILDGEWLKLDCDGLAVWEGPTPLQGWG